MTGHGTRSATTSARTRPDGARRRYAVSEGLRTPRSEET